MGTYHRSLVLVLSSELSAEPPLGNNLVSPLDWIECLPLLECKLRVSIFSFVDDGKLYLNLDWKNSDGFSLFLPGGKSFSNERYVYFPFGGGPRT